MLVRSIAIALLAVCVSLPALSQQPPSSHHMWGMGSDERIDRALKTLQTTLNLNPSQVTSIRQLAQSRRESLRSIREQSRPKFEQLMSMLRQPNPDPAAVGRTVIELKGIHEQARTKQADFDNQLSSILNPAQQKTVNDLRRQAPTFMALRSIGLLGTPEHPGGMFTRESE